jgi:hypothetical protein
VYAEDRKKLEVKKWFFKISLPRAKKFTLGKEIFAKCFFFADSF